MKTIDIVAVGACYLDINAVAFPFDGTGIPAETELLGGTYDVMPGGSAVNFCRLSQQLGQRVAFIGMTGNDHFGEVLASLLDNGGIQPLLMHKPGLLTNISFNLTGTKKSHVMLVVGTANAALAPDIVLPKLQKIIDQVGVLYLGGCFKLKTFQAAFGEVAALTKKHGAKLVVDHGRVPQDTDESMLEAVRNLVAQSDYYFPSREEFLQVWNAADIEKGLRLLSQHYPQLTVVVKDGSNGRGTWTAFPRNRSKPTSLIR